MKNNNQLVFSFIFLFLLSSGLFGGTMKVAEEYHPLVIGECTLDINKDSLIAINTDGDMTVSLLSTNDIVILHWKKKAMDYIKDNFSKYNYNLEEIKNLKILKSNELDIKLVVGRNFYISTINISDNIQKNIIDKCNYTWTDDSMDIDLDMLINVFHIHDNEIKNLTRSTQGV